MLGLTARDAAANTMRVLRHPRLVVLAVLIATLAAARLASTQLGLNTDTAALLSADLPFRQAHRHYQEQFPAMVDVFLAVIDGNSEERATNAARALVAALESNPDLFPEVSLQDSEAYFERNALLYPAAEELEQIIDRLIAGQALIGLLARDPSLPGLASGLGTILGEASPGDPAVTRLLAAIEPGLDTPPEPVSWQAVLMDETPFGPAARRLVMIKPALDFNALLPADRAMAALRAAIDDTEAVYPDTRIRVTGDAALAHEELDAALSGTLLTAVLALAAITALLILGLGTAWLAGACLASLLSGLALTAGFAALAVGELNLISLAFGVLYIGLAVDYSIHFCLAYREELPRHGAREAALYAAMTQLRRPLVLCTVTTALGFLAYLPTAFRGIAELGLIAGAGMVINLLLTFLLLPALLACLPRPPAWLPPERPGGRIPARSVLLAAAPLTLAGAALLPSLSFDRDPLNLRDPSSESVATFRALLADPGQAAQGVTVLLPDPDTARRMAADLA
ncbi:MAG: MMPL family transporter, partial [Gammaproteobacteria bacterium]|nr:MMPL family transporter [Gammaproteobacteria bacterium]